MNEFTVGFVQADEYADWRPLFDAYARFYGADMKDSVAATVWDWLLSPGHVLEGLLARDRDGRAIGIAHVRACPRPLGGNEIGFLDDLFVAPDARGSGAADALFSALRDLAHEREWPAIRWNTQHHNARGRAFYDRYTNGPSDFIVYQWNPHTRSSSAGTS